MLEIVPSPTNILIGQLNWKLSSDWLSLMQPMFALAECSIALILIGQFHWKLCLIWGISSEQYVPIGWALMLTLCVNFTGQCTVWWTGAKERKYLVLRPNYSGRNNQYHGCWCPGSLCHQDISSDNFDFVGPGLPYGLYSITCIVPTVQKWQKIQIHIYD